VPGGTVFTLKDGKFSTSLPGPIVIRNGSFTLIVNAASSTLDLSATETGMMVDETGITQQDGVRREHEALTNAPNFSVTREEIQAGIAEWAPLALFLGAIAALLTVFIVSFFGFVATSAVHAFALWLALKLFRRHWHWRRAFAVAAYAATGPIVLQAILSLAGADLNLVFETLYWLFLGWIVYDTVTRSPAPGKDGSDERKEGDVDRPRPQGSA
jgi:hypothetical protein